MVVILVLVCSSIDLLNSLFSFASATDRSPYCCEFRHFSYLAMSNIVKNRDDICSLKAQTSTEVIP